MPVKANLGPTVKKLSRQLREAEARIEELQQQGVEDAIEAGEQINDLQVKLQNAKRSGKTKLRKEKEALQRRHGMLVAGLERDNGILKTEIIFLKARMKQLEEKGEALKKLDPGVYAKLYLTPMQPEPEEDIAAARIRISKRFFAPRGASFLAVPLK